MVIKGRLLPQPGRFELIRFGKPIVTMSIEVLHRVVFTCTYYIHEIFPIYGGENCDGCTTVIMQYECVNKVNYVHVHAYMYIVLF